MNGNKTPTRESEWEGVGITPIPIGKKFPQISVPLCYSTITDNILKDDCRNILSKFQTIVECVIRIFIFQ